MTLNAQGPTARKLRWGILGCAKIAINSVIPAIQQSETGTVLAIASRREEQAKSTASDLNIERAYGSYEALLKDPDVDAVYIPLPNHLHKEWTIQAAAAGKHLLCEKPLALNSREAEAMIDACERAGVKLSEAFMYRYHPRYDRVKEIIGSGEIGQIRGFHGTFTFNNAAAAENIRFHADMGGGALYDVGCYPINAARYILGCEPEAATVHAYFSPQHGDVDMMAAGLLEFPGGIGVTFDCGMWADHRNTIEILGTDGRIHIPSAFMCRTQEQTNFTVTVRGEQREESIPFVNQYVLQVDEFGRSILTDQPLRFQPLDSVRNMRVIDACLQSAKQRVRISLI